MGDVRGELLAVCGVRQELTRIASYADAVIMSGGDVARLSRLLAAVPAEVATGGVISVGLCGALDPTLRVGDLVCATAVWDGATRFAADPGWTARLREATGARSVDLALGLDTVAATAEAKRDLFRVTTAAVVDMESHVAAAWAAARGAPFAVLRVVSDRADHALPSAAVAGMRADGGADVAAVLRGLARRPGELPGLIRLGRDVGRALKRLSIALAAAQPGLMLRTD